MEEKALSIIIDDTNGEAQLFIEIEDHDGKSINIGNRVKLENGLTAIKITYNDFARALKFPE